MDNELARALRRANKPVILVIDKIDAEKHEPLAGDFNSLGFSRSVTISAENSRGIFELIEQIESRRIINAIMQDQRAMVSESRGTTRDAIDTRPRLKLHTFRRWGAG